jgi:DNA-binding ferritin-like protein (Dps family)
MEQLEAVQSLQKSSQDMSTVVKEIEERKKDLSKTYKARMLAIEKLVFPLITNLQKDGDTKEYIKWPNRIEILEAQKTKIMQVTRSEI